MQNLLDLQQKIFFETKAVLEALSKINSHDELLTKQDMFAELAERVAFLKVLDKNKESLQFTDAEPIDNQLLNQKNPFNNSSDLLNESSIEEEVLFTTEINEMHDEEPSEEFSADLAQLEAEEFNEIIEEVQQEVAYEEKVAQKEREELESGEQCGSIIDIEKNSVSDENEHPSAHPEKKFKLAHIKGLKAMKDLFDNDPLEELKDNDPSANPGSLVKTNVPTNFMEAEKRKPEFRIDLNDKVAFTKMLFKGNEAELKKTVDKLNSFNTLDEAKKYLSEEYYDRDWKKADEYAQRLWSLVESKFL